ncbi:alpha/beta hydrolase fold domain-containing protein [Sarocladium implicatum]|nr:alpha/beta hydrolase fold domain-containing protein [Sarocladium implicatum]
MAFDRAIALVSFPFDLALFALRAVLYAHSTSRPVRRWSYRQAVGVALFALITKYASVLRIAPKLSLRHGREKERFVVAEPAPANYYEGPTSSPTIRPEPVGLTWHPRPPSQQSDDSSPVVLHFHGGAYVLFSGRDEDTGFGAQMLTRHLGCASVCAPQYRLSSHKDGHFPAALQDAITAYHHLITDMQVPASRIILSGDSAGGNLALALARYIHSHGAAHNLPMPSAITLWSPWVDIGDALRSTVESKRNYATDYLCTSFSRWGSESFTQNRTIDAASPYISPLHHPFSLAGSEVPLFIQVGESEVLFDDCVLLAKRFTEAGWTVRLSVSPNSPHDILTCGNILGFATEVQAAVRAAKDFLTECTHLRLQS